MDEKSFVIVSPDWIPPGICSWQPQTLPGLSSLHHFTWFHQICAASCLGVGSTYPFSSRAGDSRPYVILQPSGRPPTCQPDRQSPNMPTRQVRAPTCQPDRQIFFCIIEYLWCEGFFIIQFKQFNMERERTGQNTLNQLPFYLDLLTSIQINV